MADADSTGDPREQAVAVAVERAVLGAILAGCDTSQPCLADVQLDSFYVPEHRRIAETIFGLRDAGRPTDAAT